MNTQTVYVMRRWGVVLAAIAFACALATLIYRPQIDIFTIGLVLFTIASTALFEGSNRMASRRAWTTREAGKRVTR